MKPKNLFYAVLLFLSVSVTAQAGKRFTMWQLPSQINTIGNSYVFRTDEGRVIVMDGGVKEETQYLRGFLAALGNEVEAWIVSHPHADHIGALTDILNYPGEIKIKKIYHSPFSRKLCSLDTAEEQASLDYYDALKKSGIETVDLYEPGLEVAIDCLHFKILGVTNEEITVNPYNNSSMVVRVWDKYKSMLFLGDLGVEGGDKLLANVPRKELDCDYMQMAHHGQRGVSESFYKTVRFSACLWPTPSWVYNNDIGGGFNTATLETVSTRKWMDEKGIKKHFVSCKGLCKIE